MRIIRWTSLSLALAAAALVTGCGPMYVDDVYGRPGPRDPYYDRGDRDGTVQGTVERVSPRERLIVVSSRDADGRDDLRNGDRYFLYYDDRTTVEYQGRTFEPEDLEPGDRVQADVADTGDRLIAQNVQVLYDVSSRGPGGYDDPSDRPDRSDPSDYDRSERELRGTVRTVNTRDHTLEIEPLDSRYDSRDSYGRSGVLLVQYDSSTTVQFEGRRYEPANLERGDVVEIQARRDPDGGWHAAQIVVVGEGEPVRR
jgi:Domain of unknown function (DUF5666)